MWGVFVGVCVIIGWYHWPRWRRRFVLWNSMRRLKRIANTAATPAARAVLLTTIGLLEKALREEDNV